MAIILIIVQTSKIVMIWHFKQYYIVVTLPDFCSGFFLLNALKWPDYQINTSARSLLKLRLYDLWPTDSAVVCMWIYIGFTPDPDEKLTKNNASFWWIVLWSSGFFDLPTISSICCSCFSWPLRKLPTIPCRYMQNRRILSDWLVTRRFMFYFFLFVLFSHERNKDSMSKNVLVKFQPYFSWYQKTSLILCHLSINQIIRI
jgi:hypothetical protein